MTLLPLFATLAASSAARAADSGIDAHGFVLAAYDGDPRDPLAVARPGRFRQGDWFAGGLFEFAAQPLTWVEVNAKNGEEVGRTAVVDDLFASNLSAGIAVFNHLRLDAAFPVFFSSIGQDGEPQGVLPGDVRMSAMVAVLRPSRDDTAVGVGFAPWVDLPTGDTSAFLGADGVGGGVRAATTVETGPLTFTGDVGYQLNPAVSLANLSGSDTVPAGLGVGVLLGDTAGITAEGRWAPPIEASPRDGTASPAEAMLSFRKRVTSGPHFTVGAAKSLNEGATAAAWRVFAGGGFGRIGEGGPKDTDLDGFPDKVDKCPTEAETKNAWKDDDGCPDELGRVLVVVEHDSHILRGADLDVNGPDEQMSVVTGVEPLSIQALPGTSWSANAAYGTCLTGSATTEAREGKVDLVVAMEIGQKAWVSYAVRDQTGRPIQGATSRFQSREPECIPRSPLALDADGTGSHEVGAGRHVVIIEAPDYAIYRQDIEIEPGTDQVIEVTLAPAKTKLVEKQILILDKVYFETAKAKIKPESFPLLDEVASVILSNPQIVRLEVAGHTDDKGDDDYNQRLSDARANAVREYLVGKGVGNDRLQAKGYGESRPIETNRTEAGRSRNRRVEFNIIEEQK